VDRAIIQYLHEKNLAKAKNSKEKEELTADEHFYMSIAKEASVLSRVRRMRLRHAISEKLLELVQEQEHEN